MKKLTSTVTYRVPSWTLCNHQDIYNPSKPTKETCRFCVSTKAKTLTAHACTLHNMPLDAMSDGMSIAKCVQCCRATAGFKEPIEEAEVLQVEPKDIIKITMQQYSKYLAQFKKQGFPSEMANKLAQKAVLEED